ncbi:MAG: aconitate hydratase [Spirochaetales bacterium]|nr:aconitate hydratase [Spirochaetales bacterium]
MNIIQKLISKHLVEGEMIPGQEIGIRIDQTLTQDATGTMAYLEFEAMNIPHVKTELSVSYVDHNTIQIGFENADDHRFLKTVAAKHGIKYSRPGNGICHQVHLERFGIPGKSLLGSDSHTPTCGGLGMLAIGAGGLDIAMAMAGRPFRLAMPKVVKVRLTGELRKWVCAKDIILELLRRLSVKGGVGKAFEYSGPGVMSLTVPQRATITNMGAELGATTSVFPSDEQTRLFLKAQGREKDFCQLSADPDAEYDEVIEIDLSKLEPEIAQPHQPDRVVEVKDLKGMKIDQVFIGSCTNSSYVDMVRVAKILKGHLVHPDVSLSIAPGSRQVFEMLAAEGYLKDMIAAGARILECACGPCAGSGQAPSTGAKSLRTTNRNFLGRCGTLDSEVYLTGAETCAASAIAGFLTDAKEYADVLDIEMPRNFSVDDRMIIDPPEDGSDVVVLKGPNIKSLPEFKELEDSFSAPVVIKTGDNISTDHIIPAGAKVIPLRSNVPEISKYLFSRVDTTFYERLKEAGKGIIVGGENYGQGSSREHAALAPKYMGVKAVLVLSFARIHMQNLVNFGVLPLLFDSRDDYEKLDQNDVLRFEDAREGVKNGKMTVVDETKGFSFGVHLVLSERQKATILMGGLLNSVEAKK